MVNLTSRDLKPENLLLSNKGKELIAEDLKLADFGFAVVAQGDNLTDLVGTPDYIAPEILSKRRYGNRQYSNRLFFSYLLVCLLMYVCIYVCRESCGHVVTGSGYVHLIG